MARRKTRRKRTTRRRRVSGIGSNDMQIVAGVVLGAVGASFVNTKVAAMTTPINPKIVAAVEVLGGGFMASKARSPLMKGIGLGVAATGGNAAARSFGIVSGFRALGPINGMNGMKRVAGLADKGFIGQPNMRRVNGANARPGLTPNKFPSAQVVNGLGAVYVNGHGDGSAM